MKLSKTHPVANIAAAIFEVRRILGPGMKVVPISEAHGSSADLQYCPTFDRLKQDSIILRMLDFIRLHPGCGRAAVKAALPTAYPDKFQELTWAGLVTPRKYFLTVLGLNLLDEYGIVNRAFPDRPSLYEKQAKKSKKKA